MESKAKAFGHPIHQMLIPFPFGLLATAVIFDIVYLIWGNPTMVTVSYWMTVAGIIGAVGAAPFGNAGRGLCLTHVTKSRYAMSRKK